MKLLIATDIFPPESGGPATYAVNLANEFFKQGIDVKIVSLNSNSDKSCVTCNVYPVTFQNKLLKYLQYTYLLYKHGKDVDIIYAMGPVNAGLPVWAISKLLRKKFVVKVVGDYAWEQYQNQKSKNWLRTSNCKNQNLRFVGVEEFQSLKVFGKIGWLSKIERLVVRQADKIIVPSQYLKKIVISWGVEVNKIEVIYNAVNFSEVESKKHDGERWLVSVGRLVPWKGMDTLIALMPDLLKQFSDLKLKIIGDGSELQNLKFKVENLGLENNVELLGDLSHKKTLSYIKSADLFVLNSGYEGLSHVILEAINFSRSVLASNVGGNPELCRPNRKGFLFSYNDSEAIKNRIIDLLINKQYIIPVMSGEERNNFAKQFKFETMINRTKMVLAELINQSTNNQ